MEEYPKKVSLEAMLRDIKAAWFYALLELCGGCSEVRLQNEYEGFVATSNPPPRIF